MPQHQPCDHNDSSGIVRLILADDHMMLREGLKSLFDRADDMEIVAECGDGTTAWQAIRANHHDVAVLDQKMPGLTGIEVARKVAERGLPTHVVLLTNYDEPAVTAEAIRVVSAYVLKDNSFEELVTAVRTVIQGEQFISPSVLAKLQEFQRNVSTTPSALSRQEKRVIYLLATGLSNKEIARAMEIDPRTVETYRRRIMTKLNLSSLAAIVRYAIHSGIV